ncbi:MAG TPA: ABC transporter permease [Candidatus Binataceae bacterium]|nr:ABC transporter permease [Candidatus Binataceae bacterium]
MLDALRNGWIIFKHEYLQRVRTRSFILTTVLLPVFMGVIVAIPAATTVRNASRPRHLVLACADTDLAALVRNTVAANTKGVYSVEIDPEVTAAERERLLHQLSAGRIDGYVWMDSDAIAHGKVIFARRDASDFLGQQLVRSAISAALTRQRLAQHGIAPAEAESMLQGVQLDAVGVGAGKEARGPGIGALVAVIVLVMILFITLLSYGVMVMRSVLDEKASRVMEILLCSATAEELMAGKIVGVGAVGLTQVVIWGAIGFALGGPHISGIKLQPSVVVYFALFYVLGYLLYSAMFAAVGAAFNSTDEAQQWNFIIISPLILASTLMSSVASAPNSTLAMVFSMIPFCAPVLMYLRIVLETPPAWQVALCIALLLATTWIALEISARVYRVGILMYGKRPSVREIVKWLRYA